MIEVLNGTVDVGDRVAYAVSHSSRVTMNMGEVIRVGERESYYGKKWPTLVIKVDRSSSTWNIPRTVTVDHLDKVVKL